MSHFTTIQTEVRDLDALNDACVELGLALRADTPCRGYGGVTRTAHRTIVLKGPYDIAVDPAGNEGENDGTYGLTTDWWDGHVAKEVGIGYGRLLQAYGVHKTTREARSRGLRVRRQQEHLHRGHRPPRARTAQGRPGHGDRLRPHRPDAGPPHQGLTANRQGQRSRPHPARLPAQAACRTGA